MNIGPRSTVHSPQSTVHSPRSTVHSPRSTVLCVFSAVLLILSFPNFDFSFLAWFAFVPLFFAIQDKKPSQAFLLGYVTGLIFFLGSIYWLIHVTLPGYLILCLYLALYFGFFAFFSSYKLYTINYKLLIVPALWVALEYLRTNFATGFGWNLLGYSQSGNLPIIQIADITGVYGISFLIMLVNVTFYRVISGHSTTRPLIITFLCITAVLSYGYFKLAQESEGNTIRISVIQGNISQDEKWDPAYTDFIFDRYEILTKVASSDKPELIIWPETALPGYFGTDKDLTERMKKLTREIQIPILFGTPTYYLLPTTYFHNSAILLDNRGNILSQYDKLHLVPFGEYVPFERWLGFVHNFAHYPIAGFVPGDEYTIFNLYTIYHTPYTAFSILICFEDIFPRLSRQLVKKGADILVNITNDAWFKKSSAPYQHTQASVFRAVENRVNVVRAANTGVSCFIDPYGRIVSRVKNREDKDIFIEGFETGNVKIGRFSSLYTRYSDIFVYVCIVISLIALFGTTKTT